MGWRDVYGPAPRKKFLEVGPGQRVVGSQL